jgi:hypothetical protein
VQARWRRASGAAATLDLQVAFGDRARVPWVHYSEVDRGGRLVFSAAQAWGRIEISTDRSCPCQTGRLELLLRDPGPDGALHTEDDLLRRLSQARLRRDGRPFCHRRAALAVREGYLVVGSRACPAARVGGGGGACAWAAAGPVAGWNDDGWYDEGWTGDWPEEDWDQGGPIESEEGWSEGWSDDNWADEGWSDEGWSDEGWSDEGWSDEGWSDEGWSEEDDARRDEVWGDDGWSDDGSGDEGWGDDGWSDDGSSDEGWSDEGWSDEGSSDDGGDGGGGDDDEGW